MQDVYSPNQSNQQPQLLPRVRAAIRTRHMARSTEKTLCAGYIGLSFFTTCDTLLNEQVDNGIPAGRVAPFVFQNLPARHP